MWLLGYKKKKEKNCDMKLWCSRLSDYGNNVLLLFILELDFIGGVVCGLVEGWLVLVCLKFGYVKCYEIYK